MKPVVAARDLAFAWKPGAPCVFENVAWSVGEGSRAVLFGANGAGKSCLLGLFAGTLRPARGEIIWQGPDGPERSRIFGRSVSALVSPLLQESVQRLDISATFEDALLGAFDDSPFACAGAGRDEARLHAAREAAAALRCRDVLNVPLARLSQGQLRILLCARALLRKPRLLLLDEALDGLDATRREAFLAALDALAPSCAVIMAAHRDAAVPPAFGERFLLAGGRLRPLGKAPEKRLCAAPKLLPKTGPQTRADAPDAPGAPILELHNVSVYRDRKLVLRDLCWRTREGEHWRISGENGAGKSTLLRLLAGEEQAACGGSILRRRPGRRKILRGLAEIRSCARLVSDAGQARYGYPLNGLELVLSGLEQSVGLYREYSREEKEAAKAMLRRFFSRDEAARIACASIRTLSTGEARRLHLARALMGRPAALLLDEAASGLDAAARCAWFGLLDDLSREMQIIMVSHHDEDVPAFVNREARLQDGRLSIVR